MRHIRETSQVEERTDVQGHQALRAPPLHQALVQLEVALVAMSPRRDCVPGLELQTVLHPDGRHALLTAEAVAEDEAPVDEEEGEEVPPTRVRLRHVEDQTVALLGLDLQAEVGVEPQGRTQRHGHPAVLATEPRWKMSDKLLQKLDIC